MLENPARVPLPGAGGPAVESPPAPSTMSLPEMWVPSPTVSEWSSRPGGRSLVVQAALRITTSSPGAGIPPSQFTPVLHFVSMTPTHNRVPPNIGTLSVSARTALTRVFTPRFYGKVDGQRLDVRAARARRARLTVNVAWLVASDGVPVYAAVIT